MAIIKPEQLSSGSYSISGSFSGSFSGDGSNLSNLPIPQIETGSFVTTSSFNAFTSSYTQASASFDSSITSLTAATSSYVLMSQTSSMTVLSSSFATTSSYSLYAISASYEINYETSSSYAETASIATSASYATTASYLVGGTGLTIGTTPIISGTDGRILFQSSSLLGQDSSLQWNYTTQRLGIGTSSPASLVNAVSGICDFRFSTGLSSATPTIAAINTSVGAKAVGLIAGTQGAAFSYDNTGFFAIVGEAKSAFTGNSIGNGTIYLRAETDGKISIGSSAAQAKLDIRAQGALSTDIAFRIRNSIDTLNFAQFNGDGTYFISSAGGTLTDAFSRISDGRMFMAKSGGNFIELNPSTTANRLYAPSNGWDLSGNSTIATVAAGSNTGTGNFYFYAGNLQIGTGLIASSNASMSIWMNNGTAPTTDATDRHWYYSADVNGVNGKASPHFRTEDGSVLWLGTQSKLFNVTASLISSSFIGDLTGTASYASTALSASYASTALSASYTPITIGTTPIINGGSTRVLYQIGTVTTQSANFTYDGGQVLTIGNSTTGYTKTDTDNLSGVLAGTLGTYSVNNYPLVKLTSTFTSTYADGKLSLYRGNTETVQLYASSTGGRLTGVDSVYIKAAGALSTDLALRVRNSADSKNIMEIRGDEEIRFNGTPAVGNYVGIKNRTSYDAGIDLMAGNGVLSRIYIDIDSPFANGNLNRGLNIWNPGIVGQATAKINNVVKSGLGAYGVGYGFNWAFTSDNSGSYSQAERAMWLTWQKSLVFYTGSSSPVDYFGERSGSFEIFASASNSDVLPHFKTQNGTITWIGNQSRLFNVTASLISSSFIGNLTGTASYASYAISASWAPSSGGSSFPYTGSALITGSLGVTGSISLLAYTGSSANIFNIRNSSNTYDLLNIAGNGETIFKTTAGTQSLRIDSSGYGVFSDTTIPSSNYGFSFQKTGTYAALFATVAGTTGGEGVASFKRTGTGGGRVLYVENTNTAGYAEGANIQVTGVGTFNTGLTLNATGSLYNNALSVVGGNSGFGYAAYSALGSKVDIKAPGSLSSDLTLRVRNSSDTANILDISGNGSVNIGGTPTYPTDRLVIKNGASTTIPFAIEDSAGSDYIHRMLTNGGYYLKGAVPVIRLIDTTSGNIYLSAENGNARLQHDQSFNFSDGAGGPNVHTSVSTGGKWDFVKGYLNIRSTTLTVSGITDSFQLYSSASSSGNAKPYFRTENGTTVWLGDESRLYNVTASNVMLGATSSLALFTSKNTTVNSGITTIYAFPTASYDGVFIDYTARSGSNARAGQLMGIWSGSAVNYTETTTTDFGSTTGLTFGMSISSSSMIISASSTTNGWIVKTIIRSI